MGEQEIKGGGIPDPETRRADENKLRILSIYGSKGMPSCVFHDASRLGGAGEEGIDSIGGSSIDDIEPGTPVHKMPISVVYRLRRWRMSKSERNMDLHLTKSKGQKE